jgi:assimilatory nitrate reductase catalytic subunit
VLRVIVSEDQQRGSVFAPIHWSDANASSARIGDLVAPLTDPFSGQPESKATPAAIEPVRFASRGLLLSRSPVALPDGTWWARTATTDATLLSFATNDPVATWRIRAPDFFPDAVLTEYADPRGGIYRAAAFSGGRLCGALFVGPADAPPQWSDLRKIAALPGIAASGPVVCACFGIAPADAAASRRAGTRCGSCLPELRQLSAHLQMETNHEAAHAG